jgi:hypothetical protein
MSNKKYNQITTFCLLRKSSGIVQISIILTNELGSEKPETLEWDYIADQSESQLEHNYQ